MTKGGVTVAFLSVCVALAAAAQCSSHTDCRGCLTESGCGWFSQRNGSWMCVKGDKFQCHEPACAEDDFYYMTDHCPDASLEDLVRQRRSIRAYLPNKVSHATVMEILGLAQWTPTARNFQPQRFIVVYDQAILNDIALQIFPTQPEAVFYKAPTVIFLFSENAATGFDDIDVGLTSQTLMLDAYRLGLGTCPIGFTRMAMDYIAKALSVPPTWKYVIAITLGHPATEATSTRHEPIVKFLD